MQYGQYTLSDLQLIFEIWIFVAVKGYSYFFTATLLWEASSLWDATSRFAEQTLSWRRFAAVHHHHHLQVKCQVFPSLFAMFFHLMGITFLWGLLFVVDFSFLEITFFGIPLEFPSSMILPSAPKNVMFCVNWTWTYSSLWTKSNFFLLQELK